MRRGLITDGDCVYVHVHVWQRYQRRSTCICFSSTTFYCWPESKKHRARSVHIYALMSCRSTEVAIGWTGVHNTLSTYRQSVFKCQSNATIGLLLRWPSVSEIAIGSYWLWHSIWRRGCYPHSCLVLISYVARVYCYTNSCKNVFTFFILVMFLRF